MTSLGSTCNWSYPAYGFPRDSPAEAREQFSQFHNAVGNPWPRAREVAAGIHCEYRTIANRTE